MHDVPIAKPSPEWLAQRKAPRHHAPWRAAFQVLFLGSALLGTFILVTVVLPGGDKSVVNVGPLEDFEPDQPRYFEDHGFYVVLLEDGEVVAFSEVDSHGNPWDEPGCDVAQWSPEYDFHGRTGWFRSTCSNSTYAVDGTLAFGPSPRNLDRYNVRIEGDQILVDASSRLCQSRGQGPWTAQNCPRD